MSYYRQAHSCKADLDWMTGAGYDVLYTFTGLTPGEAAMTIEERSPIAGNYGHIYAVTADDALNVTIQLLEVKDLFGLDAPEPELDGTIGPWVEIRGMEQENSIRTG